MIGISLRFLALVLLALTPSALLGYQALADLQTSDAAIAAASPLDLLGLGFWPHWFLMLTLQFITAAPLLLGRRNRLEHYVAAAIVCLFLFASFGAYTAHRSLEMRIHRANDVPIL